MAKTVDQFRADYIEFASVADYPDATIAFWLRLGYLRCPSNVWNELLDDGVELYVAHNITLERISKKAADNGSTPGQQVGPLNNKSVSKVSAGYDTASGAIEGVGNYNLTNYGTRFMELVLLVGTQGIRQIGTGCDNVPGTPFWY